MAAPPSTVKIIEQSQVAPPPGSVSTTTVPLTFFDIAWFTCCPMQRIFFYEFSHPTLHFTQTLLPHLNQSLSLTLHHFFPFAGNLTCPPPPHEPYIIFNHENDAVNVTVAESDVDFNHLVANHARDVKTLQSLFPKLPFIRLSSNTTHVVPIMAVQFTVFPNSGISVGVTFNHVAADGRSISHFMKFWASVHRSNGLDLTSLSLPYHNKNIIKDPNGLSSILLKDFRSWEDLGVAGDHVPVDNILITLVMKRVKIEQLKDYCRERFEFSIPATYFGNCLTKVYVSAKRRELMGENGVIVAAKAIGRKIYELGNGALIGADKWVSNSKEIVKHGRVVTVAGSPKFQVYETDFGWGRPKKFDVVHIGAYKTFSLTESGEEVGGVEVGIVIGRDKLQIFNSIFEQSFNVY
ncbi:hypothetical protein EZV62_020514 [Acer yangbiense]|uniref:Uncharacterized protein n=1 Tax=Acer yangbiense TaxID=1000413 RepID=A0A5C7HEQ2_9ROSI|nr:hypothetical protein EZV62_020514 [Acer yangbiense]